MSIVRRMLHGAVKKKFWNQPVPGTKSERIFGAAALRRKYHINRERMVASDTSLQVEDLEYLKMFSWLLVTLMRTSQVNQWVLGFREELPHARSEGLRWPSVSHGAYGNDSQLGCRETRGNEYASKLKKTQKLLRTTWWRTT